MENFMVAINVVLPLCILIVIGYIAKERKMVSKEAFKQVNQIVFNVLIPVVLMKNIMETDIGSVFKLDYILFAAAGVLIMIAFVWILTDRLVKDKRRAGAIIQALFRSNFVLFGLAIAGNMYGMDNVGVTSLLIAFIVQIFNMMAVIVLQIHGMDHVDFKKVVRGIFTNPMLIGTFVGFFVLLLDIELPVFVKNAISDISKMATPLALLILGGTFEFQSVSKNIKALIWITLGRLVLIPGVFVLLAAYLGYRDVELISLLVMFGSPVAVSSYPMAVAMKCDEDLAAQAVIVTTVVSIISMILWIFVLSSCGFLA